MILFLLFFMFVSLAHGEYGLDLLGLAKTDANMVAQEIDSNYSIGFLDDTFGDPYPNLNILAATGKVSSIRAHLINGTVNNHGCNREVTDINILSKRAKKLSAWCNSHPNIKCYVSPVLEHGCKDQKIVNKWYNQLRKDVLNAQYVCSSITGAFCPKEVIREQHGNKATGDIVSNDGNSFFDSNSIKYRSAGKLLTLAWTPCHNGRVSGEHGKPPLPKDRIDWCTRDEIRQAVLMLREPEKLPMEIPSFCKTVKEIKVPELEKTNAEYYGKNNNADKRGNRPLLIIKLPGKQGKALPVLNKLGNKVGCFKWYATYDPIPGSHRYYMGNCSGQTSAKLYKDFQGEWGYVDTGNKNCLLVNSIRRQGVFK